MEQTVAQPSLTITHDGIKMKFSGKIAYYQNFVSPTQERRTTSASTNTSYTFSPYGAATISSTYHQFGSYSMDPGTSGTGTYYKNSYPTSTGYVNGTGDFCVEAWMYVTSARKTGGVGHFGGLDNTGGLGIRIGQQYTGTSFNYLSLFGRSGPDQEYVAYSWPADQWSHFAVQRKSGNITFWINGDKYNPDGYITSSASSYSYASSTGTLVWGTFAYSANNRNLYAPMDELCVSSSWRYDDAYDTYVVPTSPFTVDDITLLLHHWESGSSAAS